MHLAVLAKYGGNFHPTSLSTFKKRLAIAGLLHKVLVAFCRDGGTLQVLTGEHLYRLFRSLYRVHLGPLYRPGMPQYRSLELVEYFRAVDVPVDHIREHSRGQCAPSRSLYVYRHPVDGMIVFAESLERLLLKDVHELHS